MTEVVPRDPVAAGLANQVLDDVILRLEEGAGVDRELDLAILNLWNEHPYRWSGVHEIAPGPRDIAVREIPSEFPPEFARFCMDRDEHSIVVVPRYTDSQDAGARLAMQLLPGRRRLTVHWDEDDAGFVQVGGRPEGNLSPAWIWTEAHAPSSARAQVAAILRAYAQKPATRSKEL